MDKYLFVCQLLKNALIIFPIVVIKEEATESRAEVKSFDHSKLKHVETEEKNPLPSSATLMEERKPEILPDVSAVKDFDAQKLKHVETQEKTVLPTSDGKLPFDAMLKIEVMFWWFKVGSDRRQRLINVAEKGGDQRCCQKWLFKRCMTPLNS